MKISERLHQFPQPTSIAVLDGRTARLFLAHNGMLSEQAAIKLDITRRNDRDGRQTRRGHGRLISSGATQPEEHDEVLFHRLLQRVNERLLAEVNQRNVDEVYLCAPAHLLNTCVESLHPYVRQRLQQTIGADLVHAEVQTVLERVTRARQPQ